MGKIKKLRFTLSLNFVIIISFIFIQSCGENTRKSHEEQYTEIEKEEVTLTYLVQGNKIYYHRTDAVLAGLVSNPKMKVYCTVTNTSDYNGTFKLNAKLSSQGNTLSFEDEEYLTAGSTKEFSQEFEINPFSFETNVDIDNWGITAPTITVDKEVIKYRTVYDN
ncbi:MAG: hypothetical protein ACOYO1_14870 [Bacteroidales bacterium]